MTDARQAEIRATIDALIIAGTTSDLGGLDRIYHDNMNIVMIDTDGNLTRADKPTFIAMLKEMVDQSDGAANDWAEYNVVEASGDAGHVLITRKVNLGGDDRILVLSIDLVFENDRWQVTREVIFARPNPDPTPT
ncbi:hypothetical protein [Nitratireductor sp. XY-223]|uniref:hypothetical protein n=1 Tax=Nitratireductor sp. XY-223 TaxID=2561926 RepID=UPI0010A9A871|nr:hypothetical protein [Nitratireductor sp. XY-223]